MARNDTRIGGSTLDGRTTRHPGYAISQTMRKRIEEHFGWGKTIGRIRQTLYRGIRRVDQHFKLTMTASNIVRIARILAVGPQGADERAEPLEWHASAPRQPGSNDKSALSTTRSSRTGWLGRLIGAKFNSLLGIIAAGLGRRRLRLPLVL